MNKILHILLILAFTLSTVPTHAMNQKSANPLVNAFSTLGLLFRTIKMPPDTSRTSEVQEPSEQTFTFISGDDYHLVVYSHQFSDLAKLSEVLGGLLNDGIEAGVNQLTLAHVDGRSLSIIAQILYRNTGLEEIAAGLDDQDLALVNQDLEYLGVTVLRDHINTDQNISENNSPLELNFEDFEDERYFESDSSSDDSEETNTAETLATSEPQIVESDYSKKVKEFVKDVAKNELKVINSTFEKSKKKKFIIEYSDDDSAEVLAAKVSKGLTIIYHEKNLKNLYVSLFKETDGDAFNEAEASFNGFFIWAILTISLQEQSLLQTESYKKSQNGREKILHLLKTNAVLVDGIDPLIDQAIFDLNTIKEDFYFKFFRSMMDTNECLNTKLKELLVFLAYDSSDTAIVLKNASKSNIILLELVRDRFKHMLCDSSKLQILLEYFDLIKAAPKTEENLKILANIIQETHDYLHTTYVEMAKISGPRTKFCTEYLKIEACLSALLKKLEAQIEISKKKNAEIQKTSHHPNHKKKGRKNTKQTPQKQKRPANTPLNNPEPITEVDTEAPAAGFSTQSPNNVLLQAPEDAADHFIRREQNPLVETLQNVFSKNRETKLKEKEARLEEKHRREEAERIRFFEERKQKKDERQKEREEQRRIKAARSSNGRESQNLLPPAQVFLTKSVNDELQSHERDEKFLQIYESLNEFKADPENIGVIYFPANVKALMGKKVKDTDGRSRKVFELRWQDGLRVYFICVNGHVIVFKIGTKSTQDRDIDNFSNTIVNCRDKDLTET